MKRSKKKKNNLATPSKKRIRLIVLGILFVGIAVLFALRWRAWFSNSPEAPYNTPNQIDRITIVPGAHFANERTVSWRCGEKKQNAWLEYCEVQTTADSTISLGPWQSLPARGELITTRSGKGYYYTATMYGLSSGKRYRYRIITGEERSDEYDFAIPRSLDQLNKFIYIGDVQDPNGAMSTDLFKKLRDSVAVTYRPDFIAAAGDQIEGATDAYWQVWYDALNGWNATMPMIIATGNHEYIKRGFMRELDPRWVAQYQFPANGPVGFLRQSYYIDLPLMRIIVLDTTDINDPISLMRHRSWLASALRSSAQPWQIVMFHHAVYCVRESRTNLMMRYGIKGVLEEYGADLVLQGHDHAYSRLSLKGNNAEMLTPLYVISSSSPKLYRNGFDPVHDRIGSGLQLYQTIDVQPDKITYKSYQYTGDLYDHVEILHRSKGTEPNIVNDMATGIPELFLFNSFGSDTKGQEKAAKYREEVANRLRTK